MVSLVPTLSPASATILNGMFPTAQPKPSSPLASTCSPALLSACPSNLGAMRHHMSAPLLQYIVLIESDTNPDQWNRGSAYTFPKDDGANSWNQCNSGVIDCCIGTSCPAPARQPKAKRELNDVEKRHFVSRFFSLLLEVDILTWEIDSMAVGRPSNGPFLRFGDRVLFRRDSRSSQWKHDGEHCHNSS